MSFDQALSALLRLVGQRVEVDVLDASEDLRLVATVAGVLKAGWPMTGQEASDDEAVFLLLETGSDTASISLDRQIYRGGERLADDSISIQFGGVEIRICGALDGS